MEVSNKIFQILVCIAYNIVYLVYHIVYYNSVIYISNKPTEFNYTVLFKPDRGASP